MKEISLETLQSAYIALLICNKETWRIRNQSAYIEIRDAISAITGISSEGVQVAFEGMAIDVKNSKYQR